MTAVGRFEMRVDPKDRARWEEHARRDGRTLARWLTVLANRHVEEVEAAERMRRAVRREKGIQALVMYEAAAKSSRSRR